MSANHSPPKLYLVPQPPKPTRTAYRDPWTHHPLARWFLTCLCDICLIAFMAAIIWAAIAYNYSIRRDDIALYAVREAAHTLLTMADYEGDEVPELLNPINKDAAKAKDRREFYRRSEFTKISYSTAPTQKSGMATWRMTFSTPDQPICERIATLAGKFQGLRNEKGALEAWVEGMTFDSHQCTLLSDHYQIDFYLPMGKKPSSAWDIF